MQLALPAESQDVFQMAVGVYKQKRYTEAAEAFFRITIISPDNVDAHVYYANSMYMLKDTDAALRSYWYVVRKFPGSRKAYEIREYLKRIDPKFAQHSNDSSYAAFRTRKIGSSSAGTASSGSIYAASSSHRASGDIIDEIVKTVRPLKNRPNVSESLISETKAALKAYPPNLLKVIYDKGCRIWLSPTMVDKEPGMENTQPSGYMEGHTYRDCPGMFYSGGIVVCEFTIGNGFDWDKCTDPIGTLHHELGHALDWYLGRISDTEEYKHAYRLDSGQIKDDATRNKLAYFLQKDFRGPSESFAELMCGKYGTRSGRGEEKTELMKTLFPLTRAVIDKHVAKVE